jgi:hypothetical protein
LVEKVKSTMGLSGRGEVIRALESIIAGDGTFQSKTMLDSQSNVFAQRLSPKKQARLNELRAEAQGIIQSRAQAFAPMSPQDDQGTSSAAYVPAGVQATAPPDASQPVASAPAMGNEPSSAIWALPEILSLSKAISGGKVPGIVERVRASGGRALGAYRHSAEDGSTVLRADIFIGPSVHEQASRTKPDAADIEGIKMGAAEATGINADELTVRVRRNGKRHVVTVYQVDENFASKVFAHEIGHGVDHLPDMDTNMKRGNILGRIASLKKHMKGSLDNPDGSVMKSKEITDELKALTQWWNPFDPQASKSYTKYRNSSVELYAEAFSVLLNNPAELQARAPKFTAGFNMWLNAKPDVADAYASILTSINDGTTTANRLDDYYKMMARGEDRARKIAEQTDEKRRFSLSKVWEPLKRELGDTRASHINVKKRIEKKRGGKLDPETDFMYWTEEVQYINSSISEHLRQVDVSIKTPLAEAGLTDTDLGVYMGLRRSAGERSQMANALGIRGSEATATMEELRERVGDEGYAALEDAANTYTAMRQSILQQVRDSGLVSEDMYNDLAANKDYATFDVQKYMDKHFGDGAGGAAIFKQLGSLQDIRNPFTATVFKDVALMRAATLNAAKKSIVDAMRTDLDGEVITAPMKWDGKRLSPSPKAPDGMELLTYSDDGNLTGVYLDKHIVDFYKGDPVLAGQVAQVFRLAGVPLKAIFTQYNPGFVAWNLQRDFRTTIKNTPGGVLQGPKLAAAYWRTMRDAWLDGYRDQSTPLVSEMYKNNMLIAERAWKAIGHNSTESESQRMLNQYAADPKKLNWFHRQFDKINRFGKFSERWAKTAGEVYLKENFPDMPLRKRAHLVRTRVGSPNFLAGGHLKHFYNNVFLFSNAQIQGQRASLEAAKENPAGYALKVCAYDLLPTLIKYAAYSGALGAVLSTMFGADDDDEIEKMMARIPENDLVNYNVIPLGMTDTGETVYIPLPSDHAGGFMSAMLWKTMDGEMGGKEAFKGAMSQNPMGSLNPGLKIMLDAVIYAGGSVPYDFHYSQPAIPKPVADAGGTRAAQELAKYEWNRSMGSVYRFDSSLRPKVKADVGKALNAPVIGPLLSRMVRVSDKGLSDNLNRELTEARQAAAQRTVAIGDMVNERVRAYESEPAAGAARADATRAYRELIEAGVFTARDYPFATFNRRYKRALTFRFERADALARSKAEREEIEDIRSQPSSE